jgi:Asp-tRNA(Asn)/Glu-tRNA(Gln) amidotransferase A subunit family amidase
LENIRNIKERKKMKVMVSQPMKGKTEERVRAERSRIVEELERRGCEVVDTVFPDFTNSGNIPLKYLAKSLEYMADVDLVYFMSGWEAARGCRIEWQCAVDYGVPREYERAREDEG